ncbi:MAG: hypothetical protein P9M03_06760, partial [Candidatus Theseobacter exili]|nr:hypothetical protein [Candidatus Theseobacter exili]
MKTTTTCIGIAFLLLFCGSNWVTAQEVLPEIKPKPDVDENLYLVRVLENLFICWPKPSNPKDLEADMACYRKRVLQYQIHIKMNPHLDKELGQRYGDLISCIDVFSNFLKRIEAIK